MWARTTTESTNQFLKKQLELIRESHKYLLTDEDYFKTDKNNKILAHWARRNECLYEAQLKGWFRNIDRQKVDPEKYLHDLFKKNISARTFMIEALVYMSFLDKKINEHACQLKEDKRDLYQRLADALDELAGPWAKSHGGWADAYVKSTSEKLPISAEVANAKADLDAKKIKTADKVVGAGFLALSLFFVARDLVNRYSGPEQHGKEFKPG